MSKSSKLFSPVKVGDFELQHRVVLAPLTRTRASEPDLAPRGMSVTYYSQRASKGGLLISEATCISGEGMGYPHTPGIWTPEQVAGWKRVTDAVHSKGGFMMCQLWHVGRISHPHYSDHPLIQKGPCLPSVSASDIPAKGKAQTYGGFVPNAPPRPLKLEEIKRVCDDYRKAAVNAKAAGFDGVELHGAHGYLIDQFLNSSSNHRSDRYGGSIANRCRLLFEVVEVLISVWGNTRVACRLSPHCKGTMTYGDCNDESPDELYTYAIRGLDKYRLMYLLLSEPRWFGTKYDKDFAGDPGLAIDVINGRKFRPHYTGVLMGAGGFTPTAAKAAVEEGVYDLIAMGRWFIANPDLPERLRSGAPLNQYDRDTFYAYHEEGYTDYPDAAGSIGTPNKYPLVEQNRIGASLAQAKL